MLNKFMGIGNLAAVPDSRFTKSGKQVVNFTVCCNSGWGDKKRTEFVRCVVWDKLAKIVSDFLDKGSKVYICGEMQSRQWEDKDGNNRYTTEIVVRDMIMLGSKGERQERGPEEPNQGGQAPSGSDDIPF
jgi:single-strand DNA-binding protein